MIFLPEFKSGGGQACMKDLGVQPLAHSTSPPGETGVRQVCEAAGCRVSWNSSHGGAHTGQGNVASDLRLFGSSSTYPLCEAVASGLSFSI